MFDLFRSSSGRAGHPTFLGRVAKEHTARFREAAAVEVATGLARLFCTHYVVYGWFMCVVGPQPASL